MHSHRSIQTILALALLVTITTTSSACEKRGTDTPTGNAATNAAPKPSGDLPAEPVSRDPNANKTVPQQPSPDPAPAAGAVRPPVAADLAEYTKDLKGSGALQAAIETSMGTFHCELYGDKTPMTVANFVGLATGKKAWMNPKTGNVERNKPYFDGLTFHRVIPEFMIQGGDPLGQGIGGPGYQFNDEIVPDLKMAPGVLAMANSGPAPDGGGSNGSQFFITEIAPDWLNGKHTIFGKCKEVDLVKQIARVKLAGEKPATPVTINKVTISKG
jgi:peptidyl-prolyl cis-trans isomerase A (cyclophilin A)